MITQTYVLRIADTTLKCSIIRISNEYKLVSVCVSLTWQGYIFDYWYAGFEVECINVRIGNE